MQTSPNIVSCSKTIITHNYQNPVPFQNYSPHKGIINCVVWNHINKVLASAGVDGKIFLFPAQKPQSSLWQFPFDSTKTISVNTCAFSSNSKYIAAGGSDSYVKIWQLKSSRQLYMTLKSHFGSVTSLAWSKNDDILASSSVMGDIFLNSIKNGTGNIVESFSVKNQEGINMIRFSQGQTYNRIGACTNGGSVIVWDVTSRSQICNFQNVHKSSATSLSFSSFNPVLLVSTSIDQNMNFYDISQKKSVKTITADQSLTAVNFHSDGHTLIAGGMYGGLYVYDLRKPNQPRYKLQGHESTIRYIDFAKNIQNDKMRDGSTKFTSITNINKANINSKQPNVIPKQIKQEISKKQVTSANILQKRQMVNNQMKIEQKSVQGQNNLNRNQKNEPSSTSLNSVKNMTSNNNSTQIMAQQFNNYTMQKKIEQKLGYSIGQKFLNNSLNGQGLVTKESLFQFQKRMYGFIEQKFELMHLEMIRQFQIQENLKDIKYKQLINENKSKENQIVKLKAQLEKLKKSSY